MDGLLVAVAAWGAVAAIIIYDSWSSDDEDHQDWYRHPDRRHPQEKLEKTSAGPLSSRIETVGDELYAQRRQQNHHESRRRRLETLAVIAAVIAAGFAAYSALVFQGQLDEMRAEQRPWLFAQTINLVEPVAHDVNGIKIILGFVLTNSGHLPAGYDHIAMSAFPLHFNSLKEYRQAAHQVCGKPNDNFGFAVFPGSTTPVLSWGTYISEKDFARAMNANGNRLKTINPLVIACVIYKDPEGRDHHTPYALNLLAVKGGQACCGIPIDPAEMSVSKVTVVQDFLGTIPPD